MPMFNDLREFIKAAQESGEYRTIEGADWDLEIGAITQLGLSAPNRPLLLFDKIKGYAAGYRVACNLFATHRRIALAMGLPLEATGVELVRAWRDKIRVEFEPLPPIEVETAPVKENIHTGEDVDLFEFPVPKWHELDGGRYIGTGDVVIIRDPIEGWVNLGVFRVQVHDKRTATIYASPGQHADIMRRKYWAKGLSCPAVVCCGQEPVLWGVAGQKIPWGISEYDYSGWLKGKPIEVTRGISTDLPIPATAEIALEGEMPPPEVESRIEGPFGEWNGYYGSGARPEAAFKVNSVLHRNNPIIHGAPPFRLPYWGIGHNIQWAAVIWDELDRIVPGIKGVWMVEECCVHPMVVISIQQQYGGHAKQAALAAASIPFHLKFVIVVDDDIDPSNMSEVLWVLGTRCDPEASIDIVRGCWGTALDPSLSPEKRSRGDLTHSTALVLACKPYHWIEQFPPAIKFSPELLNQMKEKWQGLFT